MSLTLGFTRFGRSTETKARTATKPSFLAVLATRFATMRRRAALRREVERLDDHMLADIGISRAQLLFETRR